MKRFLVVLAVISVMFVESAYAQTTTRSEEEKNAMKNRKELIMQTRLQMLADEL